MSAVLQLTWKTLNNQQVVIQFDASISESHQGSANVTQHQVEKGPNITDHIRPLPMHLSIQGFVTNTPITGGILSPTESAAGSIKKVQPISAGNRTIDTGAQTLQFDTQFDRVADVFQSLLDAQANGCLVDITTSLKSYTDFAITNVTAPRDVEHGNAVEFAIELQQILMVSVSNVAAPAPLAKKKSVSQKPTRDATTSEKDQINRSALRFLVKAAGG